MSSTTPSTAAASLMLHDMEPALGGWTQGMPTTLHASRGIWGQALGSKTADPGRSTTWAPAALKTATATGAEECNTGDNMTPTGTMTTSTTITMTYGPCNTTPVGALGTGTQNGTISSPTMTGRTTTIVLPSRHLTCQPGTPDNRSITRLWPGSGRHTNCSSAKWHGKPESSTARHPHSWQRRQVSWCQRVASRYRENRGHEYPTGKHPSDNNSTHASSHRISWCGNPGVQSNHRAVYTRYWCHGPDGQATWQRNACAKQISQCTDRQQWAGKVHSVQTGSSGLAKFTVYRQAAVGWQSSQCTDRQQWAGKVAQWWTKKKRGSWPWQRPRWKK